MNSLFIPMRRKAAWVGSKPSRVITRGSPWRRNARIRNYPYLNNVVEQDHRRVKSRVAPMLGFKRFFNARRVLSGVELVQKIIKGQFGLPESFGTDPFQVWHNVLAA